jgi:hypothetical protein
MFEWYEKYMTKNSRLKAENSVLKKHIEELEVLAGKNKIVTIEKEIIKYVRADFYNQNDPDYIAATGKLLEDSRFVFFLEDTMHDFVTILQKINPGDPDSIDKRTKAALRMDGVQFLINKLAEIRGTYLKSLLASRKEENSEVSNG